MFNFGLQAKRHAKPLSLTGIGVIVATGVGIALLVRRRHNTPEYKLRQAWCHTRKALNRTVDQSVDLFNDNMAGLKKQWKKSVPKDLRNMF